MASPPLLCSLKCHSIFFPCGLTLAVLIDGALPPPLPALKFGTCIPPFYLVLLLFCCKFGVFPSYNCFKEQFHRQQNYRTTNSGFFRGKKTPKKGAKEEKQITELLVQIKSKSSKNPQFSQWLLKFKVLILVVEGATPVAKGCGFVSC